MSHANKNYLLSTWVKAPKLRGSKIAIVSECLPYVSPEIFKRISEGKEVFFACPEREPMLHCGKLASIIRSSQPDEIHVYTIDGSPHCFVLHASVNETEYILGERLNKRHYVVIDGKKLKEIDPNAVRVARYLSVVSKLVERNQDVLDDLRRRSLELKALDRKAHCVEMREEGIEINQQSKVE